MKYKEKYFAELGKELDGLPLKERLLQELSDHVEDLEKDVSNSLTPEEMNHKIGDPKYVKNVYHAVLHPMRGLYFVAEGLFYGLLLLPLAMFSLIFQGGRLIDFFNNPFLVAGADLLIIIIGLIFFCALWFIGYAYAFGRWRILVKTTGYPLWAWVALIMLPSGVLWGGAVIVFLSESITGRDVFSICATGGFVIALLTYFGWLAFKKSKMHLKGDGGVWSKRISIALFVYFVAYGLFRILTSYGLLQDLSSVQSMIFLPFVPFFVVEFIMLVFGTILFSDFNSDLVYGTLAIDFLGLILIFLIIQAVIDVIKNKRVNYLRLGLAFLAITLLLVNPQAYVPKIEWQVPVIHISENIEKEQHGIFYGILKYANQKEGRLYDYEVKWQNGVFIVTQNSGKVFAIDPEVLNEDSYAGIVSLAESVDEFQGKQIIWPEELACFMDGERVDSVVEPFELYNCDKLTRGDEIIFEMEDFLIISDIAVSEDGERFMMVIDSGYYDPGYVYLLNF